MVYTRKTIRKGEEILNDFYIEKSAKLFLEGYNCAQSVFASFAPLYGMNEKDALKLASSFGAGMGRMREVCGTVSAMTMIASLENGNIDPNDTKAKKENYELVRYFAEEFRKEHKTIICRELLGIRKAEKSATPSERTKKYYKERPCLSVVKSAAKILTKYYEERERI